MNHFKHRYTMARSILEAVVMSEILQQEEDKEEQEQYDTKQDEYADKKKPKRKRSIWVAERLQKRPTLSHTDTNATDDFKNILEMSSELYAELLQKVTPYIKKESTVMREPITPNERLSTTLRFLATGAKFSHLQVTTCISQPSIGRFVMETCDAIIKVLKDSIQFPQTEAEWQEVADDFCSMRNFPNCLGSIGATHICITKPKESGSQYYNYKKTFSIVLMALVNAKHEFMMIDVGAVGGDSYEDVFENTLGRRLKGVELNISATPKYIENFELPYVFVAGNDFVLRQNIMTPCSGLKLLQQQKFYNRRLAQATQVTDNAFGVICSRFQVLQTTIDLNPEKTTKIVLAICYLHNFLAKNSPNYLPPNPMEDSFNFGSRTNSLDGVQLASDKMPTIEALYIRNTFCSYFNSDDQL